MFTLKSSIYAKELIELGFPDGLYCDPKDCKKYLDYCKENDMIWFNDSYGTIVHKDFEHYFIKPSFKSKQEHDLFKEYQKDLSVHETTDHMNFLKIKDEYVRDTYILTSSPYFVANTDDFTDYKHHVYVIHPRLLTYHSFLIDKDGKNLENPLYNANYAFTDAADEDIAFMNGMIYDDLGIFMAFVKIK